jgi:hypothetical protein
MVNRILNRSRTNTSPSLTWPVEPMTSVQPAPYQLSGNGMSGHTRWLSFAAFGGPLRVSGRTKASSCGVGEMAVVTASSNRSNSNSLMNRWRIVIPPNYRGTISVMIGSFFSLRSDKKRGLSRRSDGLEVTVSMSPLTTSELFIVILSRRDVAPISRSFSHTSGSPRSCPNRNRTSHSPTSNQFEGICSKQ